MKPTLFIGIPKTASKSMCAALHPYGLHETILRDGEHGQNFDPSRNLVSFHHASIGALIDNGTVSMEWVNDRFVVACVRNPWDRMVSLHAYLFGILGRHRKRYGDLSFSEFVRVVTTTEIDPIGAYNWRGLSQTSPQADWLCDVPLSVCLQYERLVESWRAVEVTLGIDAPLPHIGASNHGPYQEYYTPALRDAVAKYYRKDVEVGQYEF